MENKKQKRKLKSWVKYALVIIIIILVSIPIIKLLQKFGAEDEEAFQNCVNKTNNKVYCNRVVYGNY